MENTSLVYEDWRYIQQYEGIYIISNRGRILAMKKLTFSCQRFKVVRNPKFTKECFLKTQITRNGYELVHLYKNKARKADTIHVLVAKAFIPNPESKAQVNHIDLVKTHNQFWNLEWNTQSENMKHAFAEGRNLNARTKAAERMSILGKKYAAKNTHYLIYHSKLVSRPVIQLDLNGNFIKEYPSTRSARKEVGCDNIGRVLSGKYSQCKGFKWAYK